MEGTAWLRVEPGGPLGQRHGHRRHLISSMKDLYGHFLTKVRPKSRPVLLHLGLPAAEQSVSAAGAPAFAARHLGCQVGELLLRIDRLYFDGTDTPVELAISYFDPEHYSYRVKLRRRSL
jgi:UTRA domain